MTESTLRVGIYARISEDKDGRQTATARQMDDARAFAARKGWEVVDVFEDVDITAFSARVRRPQFERMLDALRAGDLDGIVVWKLDRLSRQQRDLARVLEACEAQKAFVASVTEPIDTRETYGQFVAELLIAQARMESANTSTRQRRKAQQQRELGLPPTNGKRCFGYDRTYTSIVPEEAAVLREVRDRILAGETLWSICGDLEARGVRGTQGNAWRPHILKRLLCSATITGAREHDGQRYAGAWTPIISPDDGRRLRLLLNKRPGGPRSAPARRYLLTGFVRCGRCGGRMAAHARSETSRAYVCQRMPGAVNCGSMSVRAEPLEELVGAMLVVAVDDAGLVEAMRAKGDVDDGLLESVRRDEEALETLARDFYVDQLVSRDEFLAARDGLAKRLEANRARLAKRDGRGVVGPYVGDGQTLAHAWAAGSLAWRRSVVGALLDRVEILPGKPGRRPFDPARVKPVWRY
jgi:DNA invertase Pin-like site-specific DNA recombinase